MIPDLILRGGTVVDGTGAEPFAADVVLGTGRIIDVLRAGQRNVPQNVAIPELDVTGLLVSPGFIDIHSHSDMTLVIDPRAVSSIAQGVTTEVVGNCGHGCAPITDVTRFAGNIYGYRPGFEIDWRSMGQYLDRLEAGRPAVHVAALVPNGNLRLAAEADLDRASDGVALRRMEQLLRQALDEGAWGYSTGLEYAPERSCDEAEITVLCGVTGRAGGFYATHTRNRQGAALEAIAEPIRTAAAARVPVQISHISVVSRLQDDGRQALEGALGQVARARSRGQDVTFDMHTRLFGTTNLSAALPAWALEGEETEIARSLRDPSTRRRMAGAPNLVSSLARGDWTRIVLFQCPARPELEGAHVQELADRFGTSPLEAIYDVLLSTIDDLHGAMIIAFAYREEEVRVAFEQPDCMVGSDATALAPDGPLRDATFHGAYTWASWFFRHFVRDTGLLTVAEAVRRLTSLPASRLGIADRGLLVPGAWADLAVFDPDRFAEQGTTLAPNRTAVGMVHVFVEGVHTVADGALTGRRGGRVLRRN